MGTNYDEVAPHYDQRYERNRYPGSTQAVLRFAGDIPQRVLELGCGSGHWLALLTANGHRVTGLDPSSGMLGKAQQKVPTVQLVRGEAEALPFDSGSFDRVLNVNALHHFRDVRAALREGRRVLCASGALLIIGLDPACGQDSWCIYDFFPGTLARDLERFPATHLLREWLRAEGFIGCHSEIAERLEHDVPARTALADGSLSRHVTSQLTDLSEAAYAEGIAAIEAAATAAEADGDALHLCARLHLFATVACAE